ncbi:MAG: flagellar biosynthetic protein FliO [Gammaproteobacteria bacterium]|nr:MAG: flagellar biosynthetic protein FliO [Gammaproteobacteria bacterium]
MKININKIICVFFLFIVSSSRVYSIEKDALSTVSADPMSGQYLIQLIFGLIVVIACIVVLAWFAKRINRLQSTSGDLMTILGGISMGTREKVVLLQVGKQQLLIGVAPGRINTLHVLDMPVDCNAVSTGKNLSESFSNKLKSIIKEGEK